MAVTGRNKPRRNYRKEYDNYQGTAEQKKKRASRNAARMAMARKGVVKKGDGKDVAHKNGNAKDNRPNNLAVKTKTQNRSYPRTRTAGKRNARSQGNTNDMAKQNIGAIASVYKKRITRPGRHSKKPNKQYKVKSYWG